MREFSIENELKKKIKKIVNKDKALYDVLMNKMNGILSCYDVDHYKNLRSPLQHLKRAHIKGPFILTFRYIEAEDKIIFYDLDHHDNIYR